jgi:hypothetical protein
LPYLDYLIHSEVSKKIYFSLSHVAKFGNLVKFTCGGLPIHLPHEIEKKTLFASCALINVLKKRKLFF